MEVLLKPLMPEYVQDALLWEVMFRLQRLLEVLGQMRLVHPVWVHAADLGQALHVPQAHTIRRGLGDDDLVVEQVVFSEFP